MIKDLGSANYLRLLLSILKGDVPRGNDGAVFGYKKPM
jgi:hypothetical protein